MINDLLKPGQIGNLQLKNRIIYSPITFKLGDHQGHLTEAEVDSMIYRAKQKYAPALIIFPGLNNTITNERVSAININSDDTMFSLRKQVARVQQYDVKTAAEIGVLGFLPDGTSAGASDIRYPIAFREMSHDDIHIFIEKWRQMALRVKKAGFDAIYMQTSVAKKILGVFISPFTNHRQDEYGGSIENRARLLIEVLQAIRQAVGDDYPILLDLKVDECLGEKGIQLEEGLALAKLVAPYVNAIMPVVGCESSVDSIYAPYHTEKGYTLPYVTALKEALPHTTIIAGGKLGDPVLANKAVADKGADFVSLGRPLFTDPQWITKATEQSQPILQCIGCLNCYTETSRQEIYPMQRACTVNPCNLREDRYYDLTKAEQAKNILVVGGGLAGMEAAATLAKRGHNVTLCEKTNTLGGQFLVACQEKEKKDYRTLIPYKQHVLEESGATILTNTEVDKAFLQTHQPDIVVLATGATPKILPTPDLQRVNVVQGNDVITKTAAVGERVVVIGGRFIGLSVAIQLAEAGKQVAVVDMTDLAVGVNPKLIKYYAAQLAAQKVRLYPNAPVVEINDQGVEIMLLNFPVLLEADTVVLAIGTKPQNDLVTTLQELQIPYCSIGDCKRIGDALYAIRDGADVGRLL